MSAACAVDACKNVTSPVPVERVPSAVRARQDVTSPVPGVPSAVRARQDVTSPVLVMPFAMRARQDVTSPVLVVPFAMRARQLWRPCGRPCTPLGGITDDTESDSEHSSAPVTPLADSRPVPFRFLSAQHGHRPTLSRTVSKTTLSLENVELWESDSEGDLTPAVSVTATCDQPFTILRQTIDFADVRRSGSPVACKRTKRDTPPSTATNCAGREATKAVVWSDKRPTARLGDSRAKPRTPPARVVRGAFPNPKSSTTGPTRHTTRSGSFEKVGLHKPVDRAPRRSFKPLENSCIAASVQEMDSGALAASYTRCHSGAAPASAAVTSDRKTVTFSSVVIVKGYDTAAGVNSERETTAEYMRDGRDGTG